jgi:LPXTG-site transpeptidase (sortase) family protein
MKITLRGQIARQMGGSFLLLHRVALIAGAGLVFWPAFVFLDSAYAQWSGNRLIEQATPTPRDTILPADHQSRRTQTRKARGEVLGRFEVPRLGLSYVLLEGTDDRTLDKSIGHVENTGHIGESGNIGIAGHRNTHFRKLEWIRRGDDIVLTSPEGEFRYKVEWIRLVEPTDVAVLDPSHGPAVTLVTCFPFEYVGGAPLRHIVRALPVDASRADTPPAPPAAGSNP